MEGLELYDILLDGFIEVLHLHGVKEVEIPNTLTLSIAEKCIKKLKNTSTNNKYTAPQAKHKSCHNCGGTLIGSRPQSGENHCRMCNHEWA